MFVDFFFNIYFMENNIKQLSKNPFKIENKLQKEKEAFIKLIDKYSKIVDGDDKLAKDVESMLVKTQDPIKLWIKSNVLDQLGYDEWAVQFKIKAEELGYFVNGVNEAIENEYVASVNFIFKNEIGLDAFKQEMNNVLSNTTITDNLVEHSLQYNTSSIETKNTENNMEIENNCNCEEGNCNCQTNETWQEDQEKLDGSKFRNVTVTFKNGETINTNMSGHLTDDEILDYYRIGKMFNIGKGEYDNMQAVENVVINENFFNVETETGLQITGSTQIDNQKIGDVLDTLNLPSEWNPRENYWLVKANEEDYDSLESTIQNEFDSLGVNARFEGVFENFTQQFTYEPRELKPWNIFKEEDKTEKPELDPYAVYKLIENDAMLKFAYDQLKTGDFEEDMKMMHNTYIKKDDDLSDALKTYEQYTTYLVEEANNNKYANKIYEILDVYELTNTMDDSDKKLLALVINKMVKQIDKYVDSEKQMFALYTQEVKQALVAAFDELTILEIIEKFKSSGFTMQDLTDDENKLNLDDVFGIPPSATNLILYTLTSIDTTDLLYLEQDLGSIVFMACTAIILKASIGLSID